MGMTTAKVEHRNYVPTDYIAINFCKVEFYGKREFEMTQKWKEKVDLRRKRYGGNIQKNEEKINELVNELKKIKSFLKTSRPFYRVWWNKEEKEMLKRTEEITEEIDELEDENKKLKYDVNFNAFEIYQELAELLKKNGFIFTNLMTAGRECPTKCETWVCEDED